MRILFKLATKLAFLVIMVVLSGGALRHGSNFVMQVPGASGGGGAEARQFSSEEADLMSTVFQSALKLFSGTASRDELASELSDKLYSGRADTRTMSELGIELVKPGGGPSPLEGGANSAPAQPNASGAKMAVNANGAIVPPGAVGAKVPPGANGVNSPAAARLAKKRAGQGGQSPAERLASSSRLSASAQLWKRVKRYSVELGLVPVVLLGMLLVQRIRHRSKADDFLPEGLAIQIPADSETMEMKHAVHALKAEEFELLVALIYQRQGYRVSLPAGLGGERGVDFTLARKSEKVLVRCKNLSLDHKLTVERVRELQEAVAAAGATRGLYVASCGFTWDARNLAKAKKVTLINARTLDELLTVAREKPDEDLLAVSEWAPKLLSKTEITTPRCPTCEAKMDQLNTSASAVWVCSQRPECRGRRSARKYQKPVPAAARKAAVPADEVSV